MTASIAPSVTDHYRVELPTYSGPMDLLLYLVRRHEIDLHDIPMAKLTQQYLDHLTHIQSIDIDVAGEFLVMAATLIEIKSAVLAPRLKNDGADTDDTAATPENPLDPRYELVQQLLAYKRFKDASAMLDEARHQWEARYPLRPGRQDRAVMDDAEENDAPPLELDLEDVNIMDLCEAFARVMETVGRGPAQHEVLVDDTPIALHAEDILDRLKRDGPMTLQQIFAGRSRRVELIGLFLATLELVRQRAIVIGDAGDGCDDSLQISLRPPDPPDTSEVTDIA